ncbi:MAG: ABC transporter permease [Acidobacteriota bacterium]|nr:ABC transporter permease [Acidobacteriota bacterium]
MQWFKQLLARGRRYDDLAISIKEHLEEKVEELIENGMSRESAERTARREFGNVTLIEEHSREVWGWPTLDSIWADVKFALRQLIRTPGFTATAVLTLSLGIAVNATMFSLVSAFLLPHLPGRNPQSVVVVSSVNPSQGDTNPVSAPNYLAWRTHTRLFVEVAAADEYRTASLTGQGQPETVSDAAVSPNYFKVFGVSPQLGRSFVAGEDRPGRDHVLILSHGLWEGRFASDPSIIGRTVRVDREDYVVVGVMKADFQLLGFTPKIWTPLVLTAADRTAAARKDRSLYLFARLAPGVTLQQARAEIRILATRSAMDFPAIEKRWGAAVRTLGDFLVHSFGIRTALAVLMTTVSFVLLIACANVAGLLLTRAAGRQKELAIRVSLGASRVRVVRQLLTEGLVIALLGGGVGLLLTYIGISLVRANLSFNEAISAVPVSLDGKVLLFVLGVSLVSATLSSLAPALKASHTDTNAGLKSESRTTSAGRSHSRLRAVLVNCEIALALFLLIGTSLLIRGVFLLDHQQLGFRTDHLLTARVALDQTRYNDASHQLLFVRGLIRNLQQIPGVEDVAVAADLPATNPDTVPIHIEGEPNLPANEQRGAHDAVVTADYFNALGIPLLRGRTFMERDDASGPRVVLVNEEFVHRYFERQNPVGKRIQPEGAAPTWGEIVGVVSNVKSYSEETRVDPEIYESFLQRPVPSFSLMLRSNVEPHSLIPALRHAVAKLDAELPLANVMSMDTVIKRQRNGDPLFLRLLGTFAILALILATIGIYGLIAYSVSQRTHEIGIRIALGAGRSDILWMILREGLKMAAIGSALGLIMALPLPRLFNAIFEGLHFGAPGVYVVVLAAILIVATFATYVPARRATHVDPNAALRDQ